jgi:hypothetical protein
MKKQKKIKEKKKDKTEKQLVIIIVVMALIVLGIVAGYFIIQGQKKFDFIGLHFEKTKYGQLDFYYAKTQVTRPDGRIVNYNMYLRNDPRSLNLPEVRVEYIKGKNVYISLDPSLGECSDGTLAFTTLGSFFGVTGIRAEAALTNKTESEEKQISYITCENTKDSTVFVFEEGETREIIKKDNCYVVSVPNCELVESVEEIILGTIATSRGYIQ